MNLSPTEIIQPMMDAALKAASIALRRRQQGVQERVKPDGSKVSSGDYQAQQIIEAELQKISPAIAHTLDVPHIDFLMEESLDGKKHDFSRRAQGAHWVVDPIDGTKGYTQKLGQAPYPWAVSIALELSGRTIAAVVYEASLHEYGTHRKDFVSINPAHPQGKLFWAHRDVASAYCLEGGFTVTPLNAREDFRQRYQNLPGVENLPTLEGIPQLEAYYAQANAILLDKSTRIHARAQPMIDGFYQDGQTRNKATDATVKHAFCQQAGLRAGTYTDCYSAVAGAMHAADGRASTYLAGRCFPWDASAARLILEKSATPFIEFSIPGNDEQRSMLIAGRDRATFERMRRTVLDMRHDGAPIVEEPPKVGILKGVTSFLGLKQPA